MLVSVIDDGVDPTLRFRATATLINILGVTHRYEEAYMRLNELMAELPKITDTAARFQGLGEAAQLLSAAGQYDLAIDYADQMLQDLPPGEGICRGKYHALHARYKNGSATASDPEFSALASDMRSGWANPFRRQLARGCRCDAHPRGLARESREACCCRIYAKYGSGYPSLTSDVRGAAGAGLSCAGKSAGQPSSTPPPPSALPAWVNTPSR